MNNEDEGSGRWKKMKKVEKKLGVDGVPLDLGEMHYLMVVV